MKVKLLPILCLSLVLVSCGEGEKSKHVEEVPVSESDETMEQGEQVNELADFKFHTMIANLPSPLQTFQIISNVEMEMSGVSLTPTDRASKLATVSARAYGYGVYMTDMGFMAYQHQNQKTLDYLHVCRDLAEKLGAGEVFDRTISTNFEENTSNEEQFVRMMDEAFTSMDEYMVNNERFVNATEIFVGSWVESQIIATRILKGKELNENNRAVYEGIYAQKQHASNLMNVLGEIDQEINKSVFTSVEDLMMFYAGFTNIEGITQEDLAELETKLMTLKNQLMG